MEKLLAAESTECRTVHNGLVDDGDAFRSEMQLKGVGLAVRTGLGGKARIVASPRVSVLSQRTSMYMASM